MFGRSNYVLQGKTRVSEFRLTWELIFPAQGHVTTVATWPWEVFLLIIIFFSIGECRIADHLEFSINKVNSASDTITSKESVHYG